MLSHKLLIGFVFLAVLLSIGCKSEEAVVVDTPTSAAPVTTAEAPVVPAQPTPPVAADAFAAPVDLGAIMVAPQDSLGKEISGNVIVGDVISDRGFYVTDGKRRLFAVLREATPEKIDIDKGQRISFKGSLLQQEKWSEVSGELVQDS